ncbi:MAG: DinB family protein [Chloroflexota bacterium]
MFRFIGEAGQLTQENSSLSFSIEWWHAYQGLLKQAIAPLTAEQLTLRLGSQRSAGEIIAHMIMARAWYLHGIMGEGNVEIEALIGWDAPDAPPRSSAEILAAFDQTWALLTACLARWTAAEMGDMFFINWRGHDESRAWVVWHILEHEIHHGGELSFTLGSFGLAGVDV